MRQLTGPDAFHVLSERPSEHMHTIKVVIVDRASTPEPLTYPSARRWAAHRFPQVAPLRRRLVMLPLHLARPVWIEEQSIDVDQHLYRAVLPAPGTTAQLDELISDVASRPLDRRHPLWESWFVEGLEGDRIAYVVKIHHSLADGFASVRILEEMFDDATVPAAAEPADRMPSKLALFRFGVRSQLQSMRHMRSVVHRTRVAMKAGRERKKTGATPATRPLTAPLTRFNRRLTANRIFVDATLSLDEMREVKNALGGSLNDVFLAVCSGALRRYLVEHDELPDEPLTAAMPMSIRKPDQPDLYGNYLSAWYVTLATNVAHPVERYDAVVRSAEAMREWVAADPGLAAAWQEYFWLYRLVALYPLYKILEPLTKKAAYGVIVSNVRGPHQMTHQGAPVVGIRSMGPLSFSLGLNFTAWSYDGEFSVGIQACRDHVPDLQRIGDLVVEELGVLRAAAAARPPSVDGTSRSAQPSAIPSGTT
jgi:diacylglycerol O-acyltransferase